MSGPNTPNDAAGDRSPRSQANVRTGEHRATVAGGGSVPRGVAPLSRIGRFPVRRPLGGGSFGQVYLAYDEHLDREVAIKVPKADEMTAEDKEAFLKEGKATAAIHDEHVCPVYEAGIDGDLPYIVMRCVAGGTLESVMKRAAGPMPTRTAVVVALQLARGLTAAHAHGVIHRDLKPANVLYDKTNRKVLIADFGLARIVARSTSTSSGGGKGTPLYMPPEQWSPARWGPIGERADVYSLGAIFYETLTGRPPFIGAPLEVMVQHCEDAPRLPSAVNPGLDRALDALCLKALAKLPGDRYPSARAFAAALAGYLAAGVPQESGESGGSGEVVLVDEPDPQPKSSGGSKARVAPKETPRDEEVRETISGTRGRTEPDFSTPPRQPDVFGSPDAVPEPPAVARRTARQHPGTAGGTPPWVWVVLAFAILLVVGFVLALVLDTRRPDSSRPTQKSADAVPRKLEATQPTHAGGSNGSQFLGCV